MVEAALGQALSGLFLLTTHTSSSPGLTVYSREYGSGLGGGMGGELCLRVLGVGAESRPQTKNWNKRQRQKQGPEEPSLTLLGMSIGHAVVWVL